ncbi:hypothetical protein I3842_15G078700 [Carya illinoinensis]|uniref:Leucine-rich repeat-containing N-terminal plant-type domain-containing protein n=1 Tax=Carya illinoinensis TaxID=32201 RepID=A0A922D6H1_CARIL|nr:hypothetical protein I3842_15G078700 [Carya illinoinensis]
MFFFCPLVFSELPSNQRNAMIDLSNLLNKTDLSWNISKEPCSWNRVTCSSGNSSITEISFSGFSLSSSDFLPRLCKIDSLRSIDVSNNALTLIPEGFIKDCGKIGGLELLNISRNRLVGPLPTFQGFVGLKFLDLSFNSLNGNINLQLDGLIALKSLNLSANHFSGLIPTNLGKAMDLEQLELSANAFEGRIPDQIMGYQNLTLIDLGVNNLSGPVPDRIKDLSKLEVLILSSNNFRGQIPAAISNIRTLSRFAANQNHFEGTIPSGITRFLKNLDLSYNKLNGSIPTDMLSPSNLQSVDLSYNLLNGLIPSNISPSLVRLRLGSNSLDGPIPSSVFGKLEKLILALLNLAGNNLTGTLPGQLGNLSHLQVMKLQSNRLVGEIPVEIALLQKLSTLNVSWNLLNGSIPSSISSMRNLVNVNLQGNSLSGSIPYDISHLNSLLELQLGENQLTGAIPVMPTTLQIALNLSSNLLVGPIPFSFSRLTGLEVLDLSNNRLTGEIPQFLTEMRSLTRLVLSNNQLSGNIPKFPSWLTVNASGNEHLINTLTSNTSPKSAKKGKSVAASILVGFAATLFTVGVVTGLVISISRRYYRVNDEQPQSAEHLYSQARTRMNSTNAKFYNSNVMTPLAYVLSVDNAYLFNEFSPKETLFDILYGSLENALNWASRYSIVVGVAHGLSFLQGFAPGPILLLDLSIVKIMLKSLKEPQIGDIELCKMIDPSKYAYNMRVTIVGNIYSFGVIFLELLNGKPIVSEGTKLAKWALSDSVRQDKWDHNLDPNMSRTSLAIRS